MSHRTVSSFIRRIHDARSVLPFIISLAVFIAVFGWLTRGLVRAYVEIKHVQVFPTAVTADGWDNPERALRLDLSPDAPFASFSSDIAASVEIGGADTAASSSLSAPVSGGSGDVPSAPRIDETPTAAPAAGEGVPASAEPGTETPESETMPIPPVDTSSTSEPMSSAEPDVGGMIGIILARTATVAFATTDTGTSSTPATLSATSTSDAPEMSSSDIASCSVSGQPCHTIEVSGFTLSGSILDKKFKGVSVAFSFANLSPETDDGEGTLVVHYFHDGTWRQAGQVFLNTELSNETNGGYFTSALDGLDAWDDVSDVRVMIEYQRGDTLAPARLYLDAAWLDVRYQDRAQDAIVGDVPPPSDAPSNVAFSASAGTDRASLLVLPTGDAVSFPYTDKANTDALVWRADRDIYVPDTSTSTGSRNVTAYFSVTNMTQNTDSFRIAAAFPDGTRVIEVAQFMRNVPKVVDVPVRRDVTYFCSGGWQQASSSDGYECASPQDHQSCASLNETGENCIVPGVTVDTAHQTQYTSAWVPARATDPARVGVDPSDIPVGYTLVDGHGPFEVMPGQSVYFRVTFTAADETAVRFKLFAQGATLAGDLDSSLLQKEADRFAPEEKIVKTEAPPKRADLNDQLSAETSFDGNDIPRFHFRFRTQRSLFTRLKDALTLQQVPFEVEHAQLAHASGEIEHAPVQITYGQGEEWNLSLEQSLRAYRPGKYTIVITMNEDGQEYTDSVEFYWGVLAINADKSPYEPGDTVRLMVGALDDNGNTLCNAHLELSVTSPSGGTLAVPVHPGGNCGQNNVTDIPDYVADYPVGEEGTYTMSLSRLDDVGTVVTATSDTFIVARSSPYTIERRGPTRIYPPSPYTMRLHITAAHAFDGVITEVVPEGFEVPDLGGAQLTREDGVIHLAWDVTLGDGESRDVSYTFKAPDVSPYLFLLGGATLAENGTTVFVEGRTWKIASDAVAISTGVAWLAGDRTTNSTELNDSNVYPLSWNLPDDYDDAYFSHSTTTNPSQLTVKAPGDYLVSATIPVERSDTNATRTTLEAEVRVNGSKIQAGVGRTSFIITSSSFNESSDHLAVLVRNLAANDVIEIYVHVITTVNGTDHLLMSQAAHLYVEYISASENIFSATATTTVGGTNLNPAATSTVVWFDDREDSGYTHDNGTSPDRIVLAAAGDYLTFVNIPLTGTTANTNIRGSVFANGVLVTGGNFKQGYIDSTTGAVSSSIHWSGVVHATTSNEALTFGVIQEAAAGTVTAGSDVGTVFIQKLATTTDVYYGRATTTSSGTNFNPTATSTLLWRFDDIKDGGTFTHSTSTNPDQVTVKKAGDYLLAYNDSLSGAVTRGNSRVTVQVNGASVSGAQVKSHFIRNTGGHSESSGSLVFLLRNLAVNDIISLATMQEAAAGTFGADQNALFFLWRKAAQSVFIQDTYRWYANINGEPPTDPWPTGGVNLNEGDSITTGNSVKSGDVLRLRLALQANANTVAGADAFKMQYAPGSVCSPALAWTDIGAVGSGSIWRGYNNAGISSGSTLSTTTLSVSDVKESYEEGLTSVGAPNSLTSGQDGEWDWVIEDAQLREFSTDKLVYGEPSVTFNARVSNHGNVLVRPHGVIEVRGASGAKVGTLTVNDNAAPVFPGSDRSYAAQWNGEGFAFGRYQAVVSLVYGDDARKTISGTVSFWVLPLKPILAVVGTLLGLVLVLYVGVRAYVRRTLIAMGAPAGRSDALVARRERALSRVAVLAIFFLIFVLVFLGLLFFLFA